ncbi:MAG: SDR family NAD(P)-dependent oxidoreductase [Gammaproteobacteria bacterium]|nr:SDR family NAD(P)-dependent oxidoreductase [Gammaproteobacteria bacterium]
MAAFINVPGAAVYSAGKRAVTSLTEMAALELGSRGIRVNCVCPGYTDTAMGSGEDGKKLCRAFTALGRAATVEDVSGVFLFLASDTVALPTPCLNWSLAPARPRLDPVLIY